MADFDEHLSGLFLAEDDPALGERLADAAVARLEREDSRRRLILVSGAAAGVVATLSIVDLSGAVAVARDLTGEALRVAGQPVYVWEAAAGLLAVYALASLRRQRAV